MRILPAALTTFILSVPVAASAQGTDGGKDATPVDISTGAEFATESFTISGSAGVVSQYRFRGISLSDENPAVQGAINLDHKSGFYAGAWSSSTDGFGELGGSNLEVDLYGGYRRTVRSGVTLDAGLLYYAYPGNMGGDFEYFEPYANVSGTLGPATAKIGVAYAWDQDALAGNSNVYAFGDLVAAIPTTRITVKGHLGYSQGDTPLTPSGDYVDWLVGADYAYRAFTLGVAYVDTDLTGSQAGRGGATKDIVDGAVVFSLTAGF